MANNAKTNSLVPVHVHQSSVKVDINVDSITAIGVAKYEKALTKHLTENRKAREEAQKELGKAQNSLSLSAEKSAEAAFAKVSSQLTKIVEGLAEGDDKKIKMNSVFNVRSLGFHTSKGCTVVDEDEDCDDDDCDEECDEVGVDCHTSLKGKKHLVQITVGGLTFNKYIEITDEQKKLHNIVASKGAFIRASQAQELELRQRKQNIASTEREMRARLMEAQLNSTEEGRALLESLNAEMDIESIKQIGYES